MIVCTEISLSTFEFWSGAEITANALTEDEFDTIEAELEQQYPNGIDEEELNDLFKFEENYIAQILGYADWEEFIHKDEEDEE
jgi:hypothetical protein